MLQGVSASGEAGEAFAAPACVQRRPTDAGAVVREILSLPEERLDYAAAKVAFDRVIDPSIDGDATMAELDRLTETCRSLAGDGAEPRTRLTALRTLLYESGPWNGERPFAYDMTDPDGQNLPNKLLANYLATRRGDCVSMPALFLILGDRLGLDVALARAPLHFFIRYRDEAGRIFNIETTNGAHPVREAWLCEQTGISALALENGLYLQSLPRREAAAAMASTIVEWLLCRGRDAEAIAVCEVILRHAPRDVYVMVKQGTAYARLLRTEFEEKFASPLLIPWHLRPRYLALCERNRTLFAAAEALGWSDDCWMARSDEIQTNGKDATC